MKRKLLALIGGSVLSVMLLAGCGNDNDPAPEDDNNIENNEIEDNNNQDNGVLDDNNGNGNNGNNDDMLDDNNGNNGNNGNNDNMLDGNNGNNGNNNDGLDGDNPGVTDPIDDDIVPGEGILEDDDNDKNNNK
ncbi:hypothetical protein [Peribacillus saganii]|uniref:hypothetical protein n=1 Tax=Peribacillus saganii TaxID=2303992 RepID=UPI0018F167B5|nr:hypothetical protein [Peribacillus saganii]